MRPGANSCWHPLHNFAYRCHRHWHRIASSKPAGCMHVRYQDIAHPSMAHRGVDGQVDQPVQQVADVLGRKVACSWVGSSAVRVGVVMHDCRTQLILQQPPTPLLHRWTAHSTPHAQLVYPNPYRPNHAPWCAPLCCACVSCASVSSHSSCTIWRTCGWEGSRHSRHGECIRGMCSVGISDRSSALNPHTAAQPAHARGCPSVNSPHLVGDLGSHLA